MNTYRLQMPVSLCVSVRAESEESAIEALKKALSGSTLENGVDLDAEIIGQTMPAKVDPWIAIYANEPFDGITVEDCEPDEPEAAASDFAQLAESVA